MKKYSYLQSNVNISQIEARLSKNPYFSRQSLPGGLDACVFNYLEQSCKIPNKVLHPNLYYWYIMMKQFSARTLELWLKKNELEYLDDNLISQLIKGREDHPTKENLKIASHKVKTAAQDTSIPQNCDNPWSQNVATPKSFVKNTKSTVLNQNNEFQCAKNKETLPNNITQNKFGELTNLNFHNSQQRQQINSPSVEFEYVMDLELKSDHQTCLKQFRERLIREKMQLISLRMAFGQEDDIDGDQQMIVDENSIARQLRVVFRIDANQCEGLKTRISKWQEVNNLQFKKEKKSLQGPTTF